jgi:hypothetical protein
MKQTAHAQGPWDDDGATLYYTTPSKADAVTMIEIRANVSQDNWGQWDTIALIEADLPSAKSNARLIAAAPELLETLDYFHQFASLNDDGEDEKFTAMLEKAGAAIAKAQGGAA